MASIRQERTNLLAECDWMGMSDVTMSMIGKLIDKS